jgi:ATP-binding cassette subfamily B protein
VGETLFNKLSNVIRAISDAFRFCFKYAPLRHAVWLICVVVYTALPFIVLKIWQKLIDELSGAGISPAVWMMVGTYIALRILEQALTALDKHQERISFSIMENASRSIIAKKLRELDTGKFFDPAYQNLMSVVFGAPAYQTVFFDTVQLLRNGAIVMYSLIIISERYPAAALTLFFCYIPALIIGSRNASLRYQLRADNRENQRKADYYRDVLTGKDTAAELRLYGYEELFKNLYSEMWHNIYRSEIKHKIKQTFGAAASRAIAPVGFVVTLLALLSDVSRGFVSPGDVTLYIGLVLTLIGSLDAFYATLVNYYENCLECAGTLQAFLALEAAINTSGMKSVPHLPKIEFKGVSFKYPGLDRFVLQNINFVLNSGEKLAVVGVNGAGKTTLVKLLCRLYDPFEGEILLNDLPIEEYNIEELRGIFGVVTQNSQIFDISIKDNVTLSENCDSARFEEACKIAGIESFIGGLKNGINTIVGTGYSTEGYAPSGGERQKIAIARAYYRNADIIILDEPSSALDAEAEYEIFMNISEFCADRAAILISHRLSAVKLVDRILLIEDGVVLEQGTHDELMRTGGRYAELYNMQASEYISRIKSGEQNA